MALTLTVTPTFLDQLLTLPTAQSRQINQKLKNLCLDPTPDGKQRKRLKHNKHNLYRMRYGKYRVLYNFNSTVVQVLGVDARDQVYDDIDDFVPTPLPDAEPLPTIDLDVALDEVEAIPPRPWLVSAPVPAEPAKADTATATAIRQDDLLTHPINLELLKALRVPEEFQAQLDGIRTLSELADVEVPAAWIDQLFHVTTQADIDRLIESPQFEISDTDDLDRFVDGDIVALLLRLDKDQERLVHLAVGAGGPVMVKGGPGSGKTTIAVRRIERVLESLRADGIERPRILFTTYTRTLVSTTRQLINRVLGEDAGLVEVETADKIVRDIVFAAEGHPNIVNDTQVLPQLAKIRAATGHPAGTGPIGRMSDEYLLSEIQKVIVARELPDLAAYQGVERSGRRVPLRREQRAAVWAVSEALEAHLGKQKRQTWEMMRRKAVELVRRGHAGAPKPYDAVLVDEVQDLDPTVIRLLTELCPSRSRLFLTADANQSIYGGTFNWRAIHADLRFQGRSGNLTRSHRTTYEIVRAASQYLATDPTSPLDDIAALDGNSSADTDAEKLSDQFPRRGPLPIVTTATTEATPASLAEFIREQTAKERVGLGGAAILVPTSSYGETIARELTNSGLRAEFARGNELDLNSPSVKITTLQSAKGLEFPIVAIAGLHLEFGQNVRGMTDEEAAEEWQKRRRTLYVGMTRAMRSLLVVLPTAESPLSAGFVDGLWGTQG